MDRRPMFVLAAIAAVALAFMANNVLAQGPQGGGKSPMTAVGTGFTYQGKLKRGGAPYTGSCNMNFGLYDGLYGSAVASGVTIPGVQVRDGIFTVKDIEFVDFFGQNPFNGDERYLEVTVYCVGDVDPVTLAPRQKVNVAPYAGTALNALGLKYGTVMNGYSSAGRGLSVINTAEYGDGFYAENHSPQNGASNYGAVHGEGKAANNGVGVLGTSASTTAAIGVAGYIGGAGTDGAALFGYTWQGGLNTAAVRAQYAGPGVGTALEVNGGAIKVTGAGNNTATAVFIHTASPSNICDHDHPSLMAINNPMTDGDPNAMIFLTPIGWGWTDLTHPGPPSLAAVYDATGICGSTPRWLIHADRGLLHDADPERIQVMVIKR